MAGSSTPTNSVTNLELGACFIIWRFSRSTSAGPSSPSSTSVRIIASSSAISSAAGLPLPATSPSASSTRPSGQRQDVVEVAADRVGGPGHAERLEPGRVIRRPRQHGLLDLPGDLEIVLERQPVGHLDQHQQVEQQEPGEQPQRAGREHRVRDEEQVQVLKELQQPDRP